MTDVCPTCGQRMRNRYGTLFTPQEYDVLSHIEDITLAQSGITMDELVTVFFPKKPKKKGVQHVRSVIWAINKKLAASGQKIEGPGLGNKNGFYQFKPNTPQRYL
jgi:hypothetical protein